MIFTGLHSNYCIKTVPLSLRLALTVQKEASIVKTEKQQWREVVGDLWDKQLFHLRRDVYVCDPHTGRYGFRMDPECDSENSLMNDLLNEPSSRKREQSTRKEEQSSGKEEREEEREDVEPTQNKGKCISDCYM